MPLSPTQCLYIAYCKSSSTETYANKMSQVLANNIDNGDKGAGEERGCLSRIYVRYCPKNRVWKDLAFFFLFFFFLVKLILLLLRHAKWFYN